MGPFKGHCENRAEPKPGVPELRPSELLQIETVAYTIAPRHPSWSWRTPLTVGGGLLLRRPDGAWGLPVLWDFRQGAGFDRASAIFRRSSDSANEWRVLAALSRAWLIKGDLARATELQEALETMAPGVWITL